MSHQALLFQPLDQALLALSRVEGLMNQGTFSTDTLPIAQFELQEISSRLEALQFQEIDDAIRPEFMRRLTGGQTKVQTLIGRTLHSAETSSIEDRLSRTLKDLTHFNEQLFELDPTEIPNLVTHFTRSLSDLKNSASTDLERALLSQANGLLATTHELLPLLPSSSSSSSSIQRHFAGRNQSDPIFARYHTNDADHRSACTCIAGCATRAILEIGHIPDLNAILDEGQRLMAATLAEKRRDPAFVGEHMQFGDIIEGHFPELDLVLPAEFAPFGSYELERAPDNQAVFARLIQNLYHLRSERGHSAIGCVITSNGESASLMILPHPEQHGEIQFIYVDSHGKGELLDGNNNAHAITFDQRQDAIAFLASRFPYVEGMPYHYHAMNLFPVLLKTVQTHSAASSSVPVPSTLFQAVETLAHMREPDSVLLPLAELESSQLSAVFRMSSDRPRSVSSRIYFHLYHIHDKETPARINRNLSNYGRRAFHSDRGASSEPIEKTRAIQRTLIELALEGLENAILENDNEHVRHYLTILESFTVHPNDAIEGGKNIAHLLFGKLYRSYVLARKTQKDLISPNHAAFKGDFGREAFRSMDRIPPEIKLDVIRQIRIEHKQKWKV